MTEQNQDQKAKDEAAAKARQDDEAKASSAKAPPEWTPKVGFQALVKMMVASDLRLAQKERLLQDAGHGEPPAAEARR